MVVDICYRNIRTGEKVFISTDGDYQKYFKEMAAARKWDLAEWVLVSSEEVGV